MNILGNAESLRARRALLRTAPAPQPRHDAVVILEHDGLGAALRLRYVPDRDVLVPESLAEYVRTLSDMTFASFEETAQTILEDINDQVIPSWVEVTLRQTADGMHHEVRIEDRQPGWHDRGLLDRLTP